MKNPNRDQNKKDIQQPEQERGEQQSNQRSSAFKETTRGDQKSTRNVEEEVDLEQQRKETLTERD